MNYAILIAGCYLIGSLPNGLVIGKYLKGIDIREFGSKNIGATNVFRVLGPWPALLVLLTDMMKGIISVYLAQLFFVEPAAQLIAGIAAIAGHNWSIFLNFKGGRGVATGLGVISILVPKVTLVVFVVWALIVAFTRYVSLGSIVAAALLPIVMYIFQERMEFLFFGSFAAAFVILRHRPNIERLLKGQELKIKPGNMNLSDNKKEK